MQRGRGWGWVVGGVGSFWWGAKRAGERLGDGVPALRYGATTTSTKPHKATESKAQAGSCCFRSMRAASESDSCHSRIPRDEIWISKSPRSAIPDVSVSHLVTQTPLRFLRRTTCGIACQPTCRGSALVGTQRAARFQSHPTGDLGFEQAARQEEDVST